MSWNNRVWVEKWEDECSFSVRETYYNEESAVSACDAKPSAASGETLDELEEYLLRQLSAVQAAKAGTCDVLAFDGFVFAPFYANLDKEFA